MIYEIFTYGGGDYLVEVLNGIVRIMGDNSFITALKIFLLFGLFSIMFDVAINGNFTKSVKYYISFLLVYNILFVPKVDVLITDPLNQIQGDRKVDNVPFGLGLTAHTITSLGNWMTKVFGMNFVLPNDLQYNKNGILFGSSIIKDTLNKKISDITISSNFNNYIRQCIVPAVNLKRINVEDIFKADNLQDFLALGHNGVLAYTYGSSIVLCNDTTTLSQDINKEIGELIKQQNNVFNKNNNANITDINQYILGISQSTQKTFEQSLLTNAISDSAQEYLSITGADAGATNYAITKDNMQRKTNSILQWLQAGEFLPLLKVIMEAFFYAMFPIIILMTMLPNGIRYFKYYLLILLALQIWSPLYAILNLIMTLEQKYKISGIVSQTGSTLSLYNKQSIIDITQRIQMQAGLLAFLIPPLSFKIVQGMHGFGESIASSVANAGSYATSQVVSEVASGSLSYGNTAFKNTSYDNLNANKHDTNEVHASGLKIMQDGNGITTHEYSDGTKTTDLGKRITSNLGTNFTTNESQLVSAQTALKKAQSTTESYSNAYNKSLQDLKDFVVSDASGNGRTHMFQDSNAIHMKGGAGGGIFGLHGSIDFEKAYSWMDQNNITKEDRKTLSNMLKKANDLQTSYYNSLTEQHSKEKDLNYALNTSVHSSLNTNNEVERHLREDLGWSQKKINNTALHNPEIIAQIGKEHLSSRKFNQNTPKMLNNINNSLENNKNQYDNQNNIIDQQYDFKKNMVNNANQLHQMKNTDFSVLDWNIKKKSDN